MPSRPKKPCSYPGCPELVSGQTYCDKHAEIVEKKRQKRYDNNQRDSKSSRFYSSGRWKKLRDSYLRRNPLCEHCLPGVTTIATEVDHVIPIKIDWSLRLDWNNLQSLCHSCHTKKTIDDRRKYEGYR